MQTIPCLKPMVLLKKTHRETESYSQLVLLYENQSHDRYRAYLHEMFVEITHGKRPDESSKTDRNSHLAMKWCNNEMNMKKYDKRLV